MSTTAQAPAAAAAVAPSSSSSSSSSSLGGGGGGSTNTTSTLKSLDDYCLRVSAGPAPTAGGFLAVVNVNDETRPLLIDSEHFTGHLVVRMQNFNGLTPPPHSSTSSSSSKNNAQQQQPIRHPASGYFHGRQRKYSIVVQGRFHRAHSGADVVFGIETDSPVRTPAGTSLALKIAKWLDPSLQADLACLRPWIQSPLLAAVNAFTVFPATELDALEERCSRSRSRSPQNAHHDGDKERKEDRAARSAQNAVDENDDKVVVDKEREEDRVARLLDAMDPVHGLRCPSPGEGCPTDTPPTSLGGGGLKPPRGLFPRIRGARVGSAPPPSSTSCLTTSSSSSSASSEAAAAAVPGGGSDEICQNGQSSSSTRSLPDGHHPHGVGGGGSHRHPRASTTTTTTTTALQDSSHRPISSASASAPSSSPPPPAPRAPVDGDGDDNDKATPPEPSRPHVIPSVPIGPFLFHSTQVPERSRLLYTAPAPAVDTYERRKRYFAGDAGRALLSRVVLDPRNVYAMDFYDSYFDYSTVTIKLPGFSINAFRFWDGQPLRYRAKTRDGSVVFFEVVVELVERAGLSGGAVSV